MPGILIVDDAAFMRIVLKDIFTQAGYKIAGEATNGKESIELYKRIKPNLVIMNIVMSQMDGITALKEILSIDPQAKVIMCSAMAQQAMVIKSMQAGAKDFIVKPFQPDRIIRAVRNIIG